MPTRCLLIVLAALTLACNSQSGPATAKPDPNLYAYLPPDATFIAGARLAHLRKSPHYKVFLDRLPSEAKPYEKEATEIVGASDGVHTLVLARGKFDKARIARDANANNGANVEWLADDLVAIGEKPVIEAARRRAGSKLTAQIPPTADLWLVTTGHLPLQFPDRSNLANLNRLAQDLNQAVVALNVTDAIQADARLDFATDPAADQAQTAFRGFLGLARLSTPEGKDQLLQALDRILITRDKTRVTLKADWPPDLVNAIIAMLPAR